MKTKILNLPIEPIEERYSVQWAKWFTKAFRQAGVRYETVEGWAMKKRSITTGSFLDVLDTNVWKATQFLNLMEHLRTYKDEEKLIIFIHDLWYPELTNIAYIRDGMGWKNLRICGCLHAGSYDPNDFLAKQGMALWAKKIEDSWFGDIVDQIYVATEYHKSLLLRTRSVWADKIMVTGFPLYPDFVPKRIPKKKTIRVIFPHRLDVEKQPLLFDRLEQELKLSLSDYFCKTKEACTTKEEYYQLLSQSQFAVSFALQETWGIAMQEAVLCGAIPLCPMRLSYPEMYEEAFIYTTFNHLKRKIREMVDRPPILTLNKQTDLILERGSSAIPNMISHMKGL